MLRLKGKPVQDKICNLGITVRRNEEVKEFTLIAVDTITQQVLCEITPNNYEDVWKFILVFFVNSVDIYFRAGEEYGEEEHLYKVFSIDYED